MHKDTSKVSIVIPTRNRLESLNRILTSISKQTYAPSQLIIVDSSDNPLTKKHLSITINFDLQIIHSKPSVCLQRNLGINQCNSDYILLCDDDIEIPNDYIEHLVNYLKQNSSVNIVSGIVYEKRNQQWKYAEKKKSFFKLLYAHIFGLSVWAEIKNTNYPANNMIQKFVSYYLEKGNRIAKSGWPIVINYEDPIFKTPIYSLMAALIRSDKIKKVPFDTSFYENGIGDNYDVLMGLNNDVYIMKQLKVFHHEEKINRVKNNKAYYYRVSALHYILLKHKKFNFKNRIFLIWSLLGNSFLFILKGKIELLYYNFKLIAQVIFNKNIYRKTLSQ